MADKNTADIGFEKQIWDAACVLRGNMDASEYKNVVLGLIFLKYISDRFDDKYQELVEEGDGFEEDIDEYTSEGIFFVPAGARWNEIAKKAHTPEIGTIIDDAMRAIEKENKRLKDILPKNFARPELDKRRLGDVVDLFTNIQMIEHGSEKDILGRTYEYCLSMFAEQEGKRGGEFFTPSCVVRTLVEVLKPFKGRVYDPCCGSGGMFVQSARFVENHSGNISNISIYGQDSNPTTWKMAQMNLAIRGIEPDLGTYAADTFLDDRHPTLRADYIMANPPFNLSDWGLDKLKEDQRWKYGTPPAGNANFAWLQHMIFHLAPAGRIGMVLANGIIFTTMFKFERGEKALSERRNIIVMADEAHRGQYGFDEKIVMSENENGEKEAHTVIGNARIIHDALPNATFIGFTGTPISAKDRNTREVFGDYIDVYDMTQAVEDGATRPVYYESRVVHLKLDENTLALIDSTYDVLEQQSDAQTIEKSKKMLGQMESVLGADSTIESLCDDIVEHYEKYRANLLTGKAMIVAYSRPIAMKIYRRILKIRPEWTNKVGVVMTGGNNDPEDWKEIIGTKSHKEELARKFKDNNDPMKIAIVVDMWLTGFDVPSLATMYVYKPMHGYNLMQAIARVNRVFKDKEGGLIVDYVGIASALKAAMKEYTKRDQSKYGDMNIAKMAYPKFQEKLQVCKDLLHGFDFSGFVGGSPLTMAKLISGGVNFILDASVPERKDLFLKEAMLLKQSHSLCSSMTTEQERHEAAYMEALRSTVIKITYGGTGGKSLSLTEINDQINELLKAAVQSEGVISLFDSSKSGGENFSLFDPAVLDEISRMKEKNIAVEILKKLMAEQVALYKRTNVVQSQKFSEKIAQLMNSYYNGLITNEEVIKELLKTAEEIANLYKNGQELGLSQEELAFYDALTKPEHIKDFYKNNELIALTRELTEMLRKNRTIDWQKKETARAQMRKMVKRLLKKYKYPPEDYDFAISTVISQCELWTDNVEPRKEEKLYKYVSEIELSKVAENTVSYGEKK